MNNSKCVSKGNKFYNGRTNRLYDIKTLPNGLIEVKTYINVNSCFGPYRTTYFNKGDKVYFNSGLLRWNIAPIFGELEKLSEREQTLYLAWRRLQLYNYNPYNNPKNNTANLTEYVKKHKKDYTFKFY